MIDMKRYKPIFIALEVVYALAALGIVGTMIRERQQDDPIWYGVLMLVSVALALEAWLNFKSTDSRTRHIASVILAVFCVAELVVTLLLRNAGVITAENYPIATSFYVAGIVALIVMKTVGLRKRNSREYYGKKYLRAQEMRAAALAEQAAVEAARETETTAEAAPDTAE